MPASMAHRSSTFCSAAMRELHRGFEHRRKLPVVAKGGVTKKSSALPPPWRSALIQLALAEAAIKKSNALPPPQRSAPISRSPRRERVLASPTPPRISEAIPRAPARAAIEKSSAPSPLRCGRVLALLTLPLPSSAACGFIRKGAQVRVRTPAGILPTVQRLVLWLSAVVVSAAEAGYLEVVYKGKFPRDDPFRTMHVARDQVKIAPPVAAPTTTAVMPRPSSDKAAPRPTMAGKLLPVLKRLEKEMRSQSEVMLAA